MLEAKKQAGNEPGLETIVPLPFLHMGQRACEGVGKQGVCLGNETCWYIL